VLKTPSKAILVNEP